jgi:transposase/transposase-like protein
MTQRDRDRLVVLKKAQKKLIQQSQAAQELRISPRQVKRLLRRLREQGDQAVIHGLRGRQSNRKRSEEEREKAVRILSQEVYRGFGPTLASEYLAKRHGLQIGREALRQIMIGAQLWHSRRQKVNAVHRWRARRSCRGELVQWDTSEHDWLEGRGEKLYLISMIDDATSELTARFVEHDSTEENMRLLRRYLEQQGRPLAFYTDKASLFRTAEKRRRDRPGEEVDAVEMPPTQIGRALRELGITWIAAHSPQAKGRIERSFGTAQDRLVKGLRVAGAKTLEQANRYLEKQFLPWWNQHLKVTAANPTDAHRPLGAAHDVEAILSLIETRQVTNDYTIRFQGKIYQIVKAEVKAGMRGGTVRIESRLNGTLHVRFGERYVRVQECPPQPKPAPQAAIPARRRKPAASASQAWRQTHGGIARGGVPVWKAAQADRTRTRDVLD